ncbi:TetR family transcriptional regulator [Leucobacter weissii]|uniref:TetR family transcriptional regulator n=1 Tax=Leucobacter weissii TaxID=1983706 RepID=A0A939S5G4_9MICO|nr:TetR family transcriptional regulator [Leucobacter weissii]MBO1901314.1 TetR family transcriptional regulator [Leucobacter weissii]
MPADIRERARDTLRFELAEAMCRLFAERGFAEVTVEEAAAAAGISRATFFRYFGSKEDAVLVAVDAAALDYGAAMAAVPQHPGESHWALLGRVFSRTLEGSDTPEVRARLRMIYGTMSLRVRLAERRIRREASLSEALRDRIADPAQARAITVAALAVFDLAWREWAEGDERPLAAIVHDAFAALDGAVPRDRSAGRETRSR